MIHDAEATIVSLTESLLAGHPQVRVTDTATAARLVVASIESLVQAELRRMHATGDYSITDLAELFSISRPTVYRTLQTTHTDTYRSLQLQGTQ